MNYFKGRALFISKLIRKSQKVLYSVDQLAKVGATAGWTVGAGADSSYANCPASQTAATLIVPLPGLAVGDIITGFHLLGSLQSAGGTVTVDAKLRKSTPAAGATPTDADVASMTQISKTAAAAISVANSEKTGLTETVTNGYHYFMLVTVTTAASTSVALGGIVLEVTKQ